MWAIYVLDLLQSVSFEVDFAILIVPARHSYAQLRCLRYRCTRFCRCRTRGCGRWRCAAGLLGYPFGLNCDRCHSQLLLAAVNVKDDVVYYVVQAVFYDRWNLFVASASIAICSSIVTHHFGHLGVCDDGFVRSVDLRHDGVQTRRRKQWGAAAVESVANMAKDYYTLLCLVSDTENGIVLPCSMTPPTVSQNGCASHAQALVISCERPKRISHLSSAHNLPRYGAGGLVAGCSAGLPPSGLSSCALAGRGRSRLSVTWPRVD